MMSQWSPLPGSIPVKKVCGIATCQCSEYVRCPPTLPISPIYYRFTGNKSLFCFLLHYWFTGSENRLMCSFIFCLLSYLLFGSQTSPGAGDFCSVCYHPEAFHQLSPTPNTTTTNTQPSTSIVPGQPPLATTAVPVSSLPPLFTRPAPLPVDSRANFSGVPPNLSMPILRSFEPFQSQPSSTSEDNRRRSMARMNSGKAKRKPQQTVMKVHHEVPIPQPIDTDLAVLLLPINV